MRYLIALLFFGLMACQTLNQEKNSSEPALKINQIQVLGSHNSYKEAIEPALMKLLMALDSNRFLSLDYEHVSLSEQLDLGLRKLELDIYHDPKGGRYADPLGMRLVKEAGKTPMPYDSLGKMKEPGFKVMHARDIDFRSNCLTLVDCLQELKDWSDAHQAHLPITISFNAKTGGNNRPEFVKTLPYTRPAFDSLDASILSVLPEDRIITPDVVRGPYETLEAAVLAHNWPTIEASRGKFLFVLNEKSQEKQNNYKAGHPSLKDRVMFIEALPGTPEAAFLFLNNPIKDQEKIQDLVKKGYLIRTRADSGTKEARAGDYSRFEAALRSGAQFISTDYYVPNEKLGTGYQIQLPGGVIARCNPVSVTEGSDCSLN